MKKSLFATFRIRRASYLRSCKPIAARPMAHRTGHDRHIKRSLDEATDETNRLRVLNNWPKVQVTTGHLRRRGFYHTLLKGKEKVEGKDSLVFLAYNMRQAPVYIGRFRLGRAGKTPVFPVFRTWRSVAGMGTSPAHLSEIEQGAFFHNPL
ncbi:MAG: hypothetical protein KIS77_13615 [Saprospiraceae bacterium]|nr:hypothetical protein [Saprospiraceae bacterium]